MNRPEITGERTLLANVFIDALIASGVVPTRTLRVDIEAIVGEPVRLTYTALADERLLGVAHAAHPVESGVDGGVA